MDFVIISVPLSSTKKKHDRLFSLASQLNFGALSIASHLEGKGIQTKVFDPQHYSKAEQLPAVISKLKEYQPKVIGLSCISGFSYPNFKQYCSEIRRHFPNTPIISGGKDHIGRIAETVLEECPDLLLVTTGESELVHEEILFRLFKSPQESLKGIPNIYYRDANGKTCKPAICHAGEVNSFTSLNYHLYENFQNFPASIEVSRGCPFSCDFCINDKTRPFLKKRISQIANEAELLQIAYEDPEVFTYFQAPLFNMSIEELLELISLKKAKGLTFKWRAQGRVDTLTAEKVVLMGKAGAKVIDFGLESGSPNILMRMGKTSSPTEYLTKALTLFRAAAESNLIIKINIMFYIGESWETLAETFSFIETNISIINAISAYPVLVYPGGDFKEAIKSELNTHGGSFVENSFWGDRHLTPINPSFEFSYEDMQSLGVLFGKAFQTQRSFFNERKIGRAHV